MHSRITEGTCYWDQQLKRARDAATEPKADLGYTDMFVRLGRLRARSNFVDEDLTRHGVLDPAGSAGKRHLLTQQRINEVEGIATRWVGAISNRPEVGRSEVGGRTEHRSVHHVIH
jgi:hypothetical protein